ncbi:MAG: cyclophilin-like fold protein [Deltaproteobacteria bacterium]
MKKIIIRAGEVEAKGELNESATATAIWQALPIEGSANTWGEEIYFQIPVSHDLAPDAKEVVQLGDLGYWPQGQAFCIFFGATPISGPGEIRPASAVNIVGRLLDDPTKFLSVRAGTSVLMEPVEP